MGSKLKGRDAEVQENGKGIGGGSKGKEVVVAPFRNIPIEQCKKECDDGADMKEIDTNGDGEIDFDEFEAAVLPAVFKEKQWVDKPEESAIRKEKLGPKTERDMLKFRTRAGMKRWRFKDE